MVGPLRSSAIDATAMFSGPTVTTASALSVVVALAFSSRLQPVRLPRMRAAARAAGSWCRIMARPLQSVVCW
jgi:hypothetical protein